MDNNLDLITDALQRIQEEGDQGNFVVLKADLRRNYYIQFSAELEQPLLMAEAVSNRFLAPEHALAAEQIAALEALGWQPPTQGDRPNFTQQWEAATNEARVEIAKVVLQTFIQAYRLPEGHPLVIELDLD